MSDVIDQRVRALQATAAEIARDKEHSPMCFLLLASGDLGIIPLAFTDDHVTLVRGAIDTVRASGGEVAALVWVAETYVLGHHNAMLGYREPAPARAEALLMMVDIHLGSAQAYLAGVGVPGGAGARSLGSWVPSPGFVDGPMVGLLEPEARDVH